MVLSYLTALCEALYFTDLDGYGLLNALYFL